jgi:hypothetical protein
MYHINAIRAAPDGVDPFCQERVYNHMPAMSIL